MEGQNYNMIDNVLNNGAGEKAQKEENKIAGENRTEIIYDIGRALKYLEDNVLLELSEKVLGRLKDMSMKNLQSLIL